MLSLMQPTRENVAIKTEYHSHIGFIHDPIPDAQMAYRHHNLVVACPSATADGRFRWVAGPQHRYWGSSGHQLSIHLTVTGNLGM